MSPDSLKYGDVQTGSSKTLTVTFSNSGSDPTLITNLSISGDSEFFLGPGLTCQQGTNGLIVPAGGSCSAQRPYQPAK